MAKDKTKKYKKADDDMMEEDVGFENADAVPASEEMMGPAEMEEASTTPEDIESEMGGTTGTGSIVNANTTDIPELEGKQPGDTVRTTVDFTVRKANPDGTYDLEVMSFIPAEVAAEPTAPATPPMGGGEATGALAGLLGGAK